MPSITTSCAGMDSVSLVRVLGEGAFSTVYLVTVDRVSEFLALKSAELGDSSSLFKEERILKQFAGCEEIVQCFGIFVDFEGCRGFGNLLLEWAPGGSLRNHIKNFGGSLPEFLVQDYTRMLLKGLRSIHEKGYVHADLKPVNILVFPTEEGLCKVKIADFGLAKKKGEERFYGDRWKFKFWGTPLYMSPESVAQGLIEPPLDIWSLGCVVVEMVTGKPVWKYYNEGILMLQIGFLKMEPRVPENLSEIGKDFLRKCFEKDSEKRWTAEMLLDHPFVHDVDQVLFYPTSTWCPDQSSPRTTPYRGSGPSLTSPGWNLFSPITCPFIDEALSSDLDSIERIAEKYFLLV